MLIVSSILFGIILGAVPLLIYWAFKQSQKTTTFCGNIKEELVEMLTKLNELHNNALQTYESLNSRVKKVETEFQLQKYGKK